MHIGIMQIRSGVLYMHMLGLFFICYIHSYTYKVYFETGEKVSFHQQQSSIIYPLKCICTFALNILWHFLRELLSFKINIRRFNVLSGYVTIMIIKHGQFNLFLFSMNMNTSNSLSASQLPDDLELNNV